MVSHGLSRPYGARSSTRGNVRPRNRASSERRMSANTSGSELGALSSSSAVAVARPAKLAGAPATNGASSVRAAIARRARDSAPASPSGNAWSEMTSAHCSSPAASRSRASRSSAAATPSRGASSRKSARSPSVSRRRTRSSSDRHVASSACTRGWCITRRRRRVVSRSFIAVRSAASASGACTRCGATARSTNADSSSVFRVVPTGVPTDLPTTSSSMSSSSDAPDTARPRSGAAVVVLLGAERSLTGAPAPSVSVR